MFAYPSKAESVLINAHQRIDFTLPRSSPPCEQRDREHVETQRPDAHAPGCPLASILPQQGAEQNANAKSDTHRLIRVGAHRLVDFVNRCFRGCHASILQVLARCLRALHRFGQSRSSFLRLFAGVTCRCFDQIFSITRDGFEIIQQALARTAAL